ncbi:MAG: GWxTD domain-containing protein, partial [Calditrichaeota bacterium]
MALLASYFAAHLLFAQTPAEQGREFILQSQQAALDGDAVTATRLLEQGLDFPLSAAFLDTLFLEIDDLLTDSDREALKDAQSKTAWLKQFWRRLDPTPATPENERYMEHYKRLAYAREHYPSARSRGYDDRGMIYIRYGPPDESYIQPSDNFFRGTESWLYRRLGGVNFDFVELGATYELISDFQRALVAVPSDVHDQIRIMRDLFADRSELGLIYSRVYERLQQELDQETQGGKSPDLMLVNSLMNQYATEVENLHEQLPQSTTSIGRETQPLIFGFSYARFFQDNGQNRLELYFGVPLKELKFISRDSTNLTSTLKLAFRVLDENMNVVVQDKKTYPLAATSQAELDTTDYVGQLTCFLPHGKYRVAVQLSNPESQKRQFYTLRLQLPDFATNQLLLSDLQFAKKVLADTVHIVENRDSSPASGFYKHGIYVEPYPYLILSAHQAVDLYYEIYNLARGKNGRCNYRIDYKITSEKSPGGLKRLLKAVNP